jgi:hypothetical protein
MKTPAILRAVAVFGVAAVVLTGAVQSAMASVENASAVSSLVEARQNIKINITPTFPAHNDIKLADAKKGIEVAIIATPSIPFSDIDVRTIEFAGALPATNNHKSRDVDLDGEADRIYVFTTSQLKLTPADTIACLTGETLQKLRIRGCEKIKVIPAGGQ